MAEYILVHSVRVAKSWEPETFGRLTTIGPRFRIGRTQYQVCQCSCGTVKVVRAGNLGRCACSCGCLHKEGLIARSTKHGHKSENRCSPEYKSWSHLKSRCGNPKNYRFPLYGGRGIRVCDRWLGDRGFQNFLEDMGPRPAWANSIDRIDNEGHYCPENCRWATQQEQCNNQRKNVIVEAFGRKQTIAQWARELGIPYESLRRHIAKGRSIEDREKG